MLFLLSSSLVTTYALLVLYKFHVSQLDKNRHFVEIFAFTKNCNWLDVVEVTFQNGEEPGNTVNCQMRLHVTYSSRSHHRIHATQYSQYVGSWIHNQLNCHAMIFMRLFVSCWKIIMDVHVAISLLFLYTQNDERFSSLTTSLCKKPILPMNFLPSEVVKNVNLSSFQIIIIP